MVANVANAITMMRTLPLAYDSFACRVQLTARSPWGPAGTWEDNDDVKATEWCQRQHLNIKSSIAAEAAMAIARERSIHPPREYLESLTWDGTGRLNRWMHDFLGCEDNQYTRDISAKWMIAGISRLMEPGCQSDYTLVLEGAQGLRKSTALRTLGGEWFTDDVQDIGPKDSAVQLQGYWIAEIAELDAFKKAEMTTVKAWLVRRIDSFRPAYGRRLAKFPRQNIFAATTNKKDWGIDDTGLRRFWPIQCGKIDIDGLRINRDQLWAEAMYRYSEGELSFLTGGSEATATEEQHARQDSDVWSEAIERWCAFPGSSSAMTIRSDRKAIYLGDILDHCLKLSIKDQNHGVKTRVTRILRLAGYMSKRTSKKDAGEDGSRPEFWVKMKDQQ